VLALLQPVFAAQQAPAMPQGMPPQGAMPPQAMPPEMMGGIPQEAMPAEMMPQEMPPEMMGGIGALPADQGPEMGAPVMMAKGGPVQYFSDGTDEDGVTPIDDTSSFAGMFSPDVVEAARQRYLATMAQRPTASPDLATEVEKRTPMYEKLLGVDNNLSQAQILFELGQRAFNFGANVDDQGKPLRGSAAARLAGAVRTLPGSIGQITGQMDQQRRAVRGAALQASEKGIQDIIENNARLTVAQGKSDTDILKAFAAADAKAKMPVSRKANWAVDTLLTPGLVEAFAKGQTTPGQDDEFVFAAMDQFKPQVITFDDDKGRRVTQTIPGIEHPRVVDALKARGLYDTIKTALQEGGMGMGGERSPAVPQAAAPSFMDEPPVLLEAPEGSPEAKRQQEIARQYKKAEADYKAGKMKKPDYDSLIGGLNAESMRIKNVLMNKLSPQTASEAAPPFESTYFDNIDRAFGIFPAIGAAVAEYVPIDSAGRVAPDVQQAQSSMNNIIKDILAPLRDSTYFSNPELTRMEKNANLGFSAFKSPDAARNNAIGLAQTLYSLRDEALARSRDMSLANEVTNKERDKASALSASIQKLGVPPPISTQGQFDDLPKGSRYLGYSRTTRSWQVKTK
jgi:hypothetical protein